MSVGTGGPDAGTTLAPSGHGNGRGPETIFNESGEPMSANVPPSTPRFAEPVASYSTYVDAEKAVNALAESGFPVEGVTIVAGDLRFVEQVTGRRSYGAAAIEAAPIGAITAALVGFLLGIFSQIAPLSTGLALAFWGLLLGAIVGALVGVLGHALAGRRRDFSSRATLDAGRYDVMAPADVAGEARGRLATPRAA